MAYDDTAMQEAVDGLTAFEDTKRGYGLWRGEVIHPADPRMDEILASGDPITDTKGLGLRYTPVRGATRIPHFSVRDKAGFSDALDRVFPAVHDAVVRVIADDIRSRGFEGLRDWCQKDALPEAFEVWQVRVEMRCGGYRPDICVLHPEGGRIELEVVNTHAPESGRLEKAWGAGHVVLSLRIRDLVESIVFSEGRGMVPDDATLVDMLSGRRFTLCGCSEMPDTVRAVWRDLNLAAYCEDLAYDLKMAWRRYRYELGEVACMLSGGGRSDTDDAVKPRCERAYDLLTEDWEGTATGFLPRWWRPLQTSLQQACAPGPEFLEVLTRAETFLNSFSHASALVPSAQAAVRLRRRILAMQRIKMGAVYGAWEYASVRAEQQAERFGWSGWIKRNLGPENMPAFMRNLKGEE